jgi:hypothetical protein
MEKLIARMLSRFNVSMPILLEDDEVDQVFQIKRLRGDAG